MAKRPDPRDREQRRLLRDYEARQALHAHQTTRRYRDNWIGVIAAVVICGLAIFAVWSYSAWGPGQAAATASPTPTPSAGTDAVPDPSLSEGRTWTGQMTIAGVDLGMEFDGGVAPQATAVFVQAAQDGWYIGKYCPRVTDYPTMQVLQCGTSDPQSTAGGDDYSYGPIENAPAGDFYPAGSIAMARVANDGNSLNHQFFIVTADSTIPSDSAGGYTIVGKVTSGLAALISSVTSAGPGDGSEDGPPAAPVQITAFTIQ